MLLYFTLPYSILLFCFALLYFSLCFASYGGGHSSDGVGGDSEGGDGGEEEGSW